MLSRRTAAWGERGGTDVTDAEWGAHAAELERVKEGCADRMRHHDNLSDEGRDVSRGLPFAMWAAHVKAAGGSTQADAEEWMRRTLGRSCLDGVQPPPWLRS